MAHHPIHQTVICSNMMCVHVHLMCSSRLWLSFALKIGSLSFLPVFLMRHFGVALSVSTVVLHPLASHTCQLQRRWFLVIFQFCLDQPKSISVVQHLLNHVLVSGLSLRLATKLTQKMFHPVYRNHDWKFPLWISCSAVPKVQPHSTIGMLCHRQLFVFLCGGRLDSSHQHSSRTAIAVVCAPNHALLSFDVGA